MIKSLKKDKYGGYIYSISLSFTYLLNMNANMAPAKFCQTEYNAPGTVACAKLGKWFFARPVESPEF